jgi:dTDP-4-amino-4,6-dideoxygalactose transaminase
VIGKIAQPIPQTDPKAGYLAHKEEIDIAIRNVLESGRYILGLEVEAFEQEFAAYLGVQHAIGVGNGTDALELALRACGVGPDNAVLTVSHTAVATVAAIERVGAIPILVDIDPKTYTMDPNHLEDTLRKMYRASSSVPHLPSAIIPVHLYGYPADMPAILEICRRYHLYVIEDCAQSHGAVIQERRTGTWGDIAAFSFYPTKNLGALGDGGMVVTSNPDMAKKVRLQRQYGWEERYVSETPGENSRLDELQAAILRVKLRYLDQENQARRETAHYYSQHIETDAIIKPVERSGTTHIYHQYVVRTPDRNAMQQYLKEE